MKKIVWKFEPSLKNIGFLLICLIINFIGKFIAMYFSLPFWLDAIGTCYAAVTLGPLAGVIVGGMTNICLEFVFDTCLPYILVSIIIGIVVGIIYPKDNEFFQAVFTGVLVAILAIVASTPLNMYFYDGYVGNLWGDALYDMLFKNNTPKVLCCVLAQAFTDIPDKSLTLLLISIILRFKEKKNEQGEENA